MSTSPKSRATIFPLAITVGLLVFFATGEMPGGLTGLQGFFAGFGAVFVFFLTVALLAQRKPPSQRSAHVEDVTVAESEKEITIRIRLDQFGHVQATNRR